MKFSIIDIIGAVFTSGTVVTLINRWATKRKLNAEINTLDTDNDIKLSTFMANRMEELYKRLDGQDKRIVEMWDTINKLKKENYDLKAENKALRYKLDVITKNLKN